MFNGLIRCTGRLRGRSSTGEHGCRLTICGESIRGVLIGESIAVNGVCLTVVEWDERSFTAGFDVASETLRCTTLGGLREGSLLNLERSLRLGDPIDGHLVQGHVDATVELIGRDLEPPETVRLTFSLPVAVSWGIATKGSVALDGISLTVGPVTADTFSVFVIPHTLRETSLRELQVGERVNVEIDPMARYVRRVLEQRGA